MQLYGLHDAEAFWEQLHDTHALVAWGPSAAVVAFRGTSSWANVRSDLKVGLAHAFVCAFSAVSRGGRHRKVKSAWSSCVPDCGMTYG